MSIRKVLKFRWLPSAGGVGMFFVVDGACRDLPGGGVEMVSAVNGRRFAVRRPSGSSHEAAWRGVLIAQRAARLAGARRMLIRTRSNHVKLQAKGEWGVGAALGPWRRAFRRSPLAARTRWL